LGWLKLLKGVFRFSLFDGVLYGTVRRVNLGFPLEDKTMKKLVATMIVLVPILFLAGCSDDVTNVNAENYSDGRVIATVHGIVTDGTDNARLSGVRVWTSVNGGIVSTTTNDQGYYALANLVSGVYIVSFEHPVTTKQGNYAVTHFDVDVPTLDDIDQEAIPHSQDFHMSIAEDIDLFPMNAGLSGQVFKQIDPDNAAPAEGVTVIADFAAWNIAGDEITAVTDVDGNYAFADLPATPNVNLRSLPFNDGTNNYGGDNVNANLVPGADVFADPLLVDRAGIDAIILENNFSFDPFPVDGNVEIEFSLPMDADHSEVTLWNGPNQVPCDVTWNDPTNTMVTLDPIPVLLPGTWYDLDIDVWTTDGVNYDIMPGFGTVGGIEFLSSNLESADGVFDNFDPASPIELTFNMPPDLDNMGTMFGLTLDGGYVVWVDVSLSGNTVTLTPTGGLTAGEEYNVWWDACSAYAGDCTSDDIDFETALSIPAPGAVTGFALQDPDAVFDFDEDTFPFEWDEVDGAMGYGIFAMNDATKSDFVLVGDFAGTMGSAFLPDDVFGDDPLADGVEVTFQIVAYNMGGTGPMSGNVAITDEFPPTINIINQVGSANNGTGDPVTVTINVECTNEPLDEDTEPSVTIVEDGGDAGYTLPESAVSFEFTSETTGTFTLTIPATTDASGDRFMVEGFMDTSGNEQEAFEEINLF